MSSGPPRKQLKQLASNFTKVPRHHQEKRESDSTNRHYSMESARCIHCHTAILSVHLQQLDAVDLMAAAQEFVKRYRSRERIF